MNTSSHVSSTDARCPKCGQTVAVEAGNRLQLAQWRRKCQCGHSFMFQTGMIVSPPMIQTPVKVATTANVKPPKSKEEFEIPDLDTFNAAAELIPAEAIEMCERIIGKCSEVAGIEAGEDFAYSVQEKVESIQATIEENERVTQGQWDALENMEGGLDRWLENQHD